MSNLIAQFLDNGIMLVVAGILLRYFFKPQGTRLYKRKWVLFACAFLALYSLLDMGFAYHKYAQNRIPSRTELEDTIRANSILATDDIEYRSPHGYTILIPQGYAYTEFDSGPFSLTALKGTSSVVVSRIACPDTLDKIVPEMCRYLKQKNASYVFTDQRSVTVSGIPAIRINVAVTKERGRVKGYMFFFKKDRFLFQVMTACLASDFHGNRAHFESVLESLTL